MLFHALPLLIRCRVTLLSLIELSEQLYYGALLIEWYAEATLAPSRLLHHCILAT